MSDTQASPSEDKEHQAALDAMMRDLGNARVEEFARDAGERGRPRGSRSYQAERRLVSAEQNEDPPSDGPLSHWANAWKQGVFNDSDYHKVKDLDPLDNGNAHRLNRMAGRPGRSGTGNGANHSRRPYNQLQNGSSSMAKNSPRDTAMYNPLNPGYPKNRPARSSRPLNPGYTETSLGGIVPPGAQVTRWEPKPARRDANSAHPTNESNRPAISRPEHTTQVRVGTQHLHPAAGDENVPERRSSTARVASISTADDTIRQINAHRNQQANNRDPISTETLRTVVPDSPTTNKECLESQTSENLIDLDSPESVKGSRTPYCPTEQDEPAQPATGPTGGDAQPGDPRNEPSSENTLLVAVGSQYTPPSGTAQHNISLDVLTALTANRFERDIDAVVRALEMETIETITPGENLSQDSLRLLSSLSSKDYAGMIETLPSLGRVLAWARGSSVVSLLKQAAIQLAVMQLIRHEEFVALEQHEQRKVVAVVSTNVHHGDSRITRSAEQMIALKWTASSCPDEVRQLNESITREQQPMAGDPTALVLKLMKMHIHQARATPHLLPRVRREESALPILPTSPGYTTTNSPTSGAQARAMPVPRTDPLGAVDPPSRQECAARGIDNSRWAYESPQALTSEVRRDGKDHGIPETHHRLPTLSYRQAGTGDLSPISCVTQKFAGLRLNDR